MEVDATLPGTHWHQIEINFVLIDKVCVPLDYITNVQNLQIEN